MKIAIRFSKSAEPDGNTHWPFNNHVINRVDVGSYPQHLSLHRTYGSRIRRYIHIGERKL